VIRLTIVLHGALCHVLQVHVRKLLKDGQDITGEVKKEQ
jgi:hypothetical protein